MKRPLIVGNWKMHGDGTWLPAIGAIAEAAASLPGVDAALSVPATLIHRAASQYPSLAIGGQDCHAAGAGAHTGGIAAKMIREAGGQFTLVGHSECRVSSGETDSVIAAKITAAQEAGLRVIVCVGEDASARANGRAAYAVEQQLCRSLPETVDASLVVAYEPIWAIGRGILPNPSEINAVTNSLRRCLMKQTGGARVIYGGSVSSQTAQHLLKATQVDGLLIGKSSLDFSEFIELMRITSRA